MLSQEKERHSRKGGQGGEEGSEKEKELMQRVKRDVCPPHTPASNKLMNPMQGPTFDEPNSDQPSYSPGFSEDIYKQKVPKRL